MSRRIVSFIGSLMPLYDIAYANGQPVALQLATGVRLHPLDDAGHDEERGLLFLTHPAGGPGWQVEGRLLATDAIRAYTDLRGFGMPEKARRDEFRRMCAHFAFKTGAVAYVEWEDDDSEAWSMAGRVMRAVGKDVALGLFKKILGLP